MWTPLFLCLLVAGALATTSYGTQRSIEFEAGKQYIYELESRTLTSLNQESANQYTGIVIRATAVIHVKSLNVIVLQIVQPEYGKVHAMLLDGWRGRLPGDLAMMPLNLGSPVEVHFKDGMVDNIRVSKNIATYELNIIKSIVSLLQMDTQATNIKKSSFNTMSANNDVVFTFKTMEDSVTGECEQLYDISPLTKQELMENPQLAPLIDLSQPSDVSLIRVVKTNNYDNCNLRSVYNFGFNQVPSGWKPATNGKENSLYRSTVTSAIMSEKSKVYNIESVNTINEVRISPNHYDRQKGHVVSSVNMTLTNIRAAASSPPAVENEYIVNNLVYEYNAAFNDESLQSAYMNSMNKKSQTNDRVGHNRKPRSIQDRRRLLAKDISINGNLNSLSSSSNSSESLTSGGQRERKVWSGIISSRSSNSGSSSSSNSGSSSSSSSSSRSSNEFDENVAVSSGSSESSSSDSSSTSSSDSSGSSTSSSDSSSSSSSSSISYGNSHKTFRNEEKLWQPEPTLLSAPQIPFLPLFIANKGNSIASFKDLNLSATMVNLAQSIGRDVQDLSRLPSQNTIEKFALLSYILSTSNASTLQSVAEELYYPQSQASQGRSDDFINHQSWVAYRDAVVDAGTGPALMTLLSWIKNKRVNGMEAAKLLSALPDTVKTPTNDYIHTLYSLVFSPEVMNEQFVNNSAILAFTDILRRTQVNYHIFHGRYPTYTFGPMANKNNNDSLFNVYIPKIEELLNKAVVQGDSPKIQVYIRALGNIGHPSILPVFKPYLEDQQPVSEFQRLLIVTALDKLVINYPEIARAVLFKIYENTAETHTVRCAAVHLLMNTNPPVVLLQRMAEFTNIDQSPQVISIVQSAIKSAANLYEETELAKNARAAVNLLNPKDFGVQYSKNKLRNYVSDEMYLAYQQYLSYIGSEDTIYPSSVFYSVSRQFGSSTKEKVDLSGMVSSVDSLRDFMKNFMIGEEITHVNESNLTPEKIAQLLNIKVDRAEQVEGNILFKLFGGKNMFTFDNHTIQMTPKLFHNLINELKSGKNFNMTKYSNRLHTVIAFPMASGLPFFHSYNIPSLFYFGGDVQVIMKPEPSNNQINRPDSVNIKAGFEVVYASKSMARYGFTAPFDHTAYLAAIDKNFKLYAPARVKLDIDMENNRVQIKVQPSSTDGEKNILHYSVWPYTTPHDLFRLRPVSENKNKLPNNRRHLIVDKMFGKESTGFAFKASYSSEQKTFDTARFYKALRRHDSLGKILFAFTEANNDQKSLNISYMPGLSSANSAKFTFVLGSHTYESRRHSSQGYEDENSFKSNYMENDDDPPRSDEDSAEAQNSKKALPSNTSPDSEHRRKEFLSRVIANMKGSSAYVFDVAAEFSGKTNAHFIATAAVASSPVSNTYQLLFFYNKTPAQQTSHTKPEQVCMSAASFMPYVPIDSFVKALLANPNSSVNAQISTGRDCESGASININGKLQQSHERFQYVLDLPLSRLSIKQILDGNLLLPASRNVTTEATLLDKYSFTVAYKNVPDSWKSVTYKMYAIIRELLYPHVHEDVFNKEDYNNTMKLGADFSSDLKSVNLALSTRDFAVKMDNIKLNPLTQAAVVLHPYYSVSERVAQEWFKGQLYASCVVDNTEGTTFNNRSYPLKLQKGGWYIMMQHTPKLSSNLAVKEAPTGDFSVLTQSLTSGRKAVKLLLGKGLMLDLEPSSDALPLSSSLSNDTVNWRKKKFHLIHSNPQAIVKINKEIQLSKGSVTKVYYPDGNIAALVLVLPTGTIRLYSPKYDLEILYDAYRVKLQANSRYMSKVRGICGTYTGDYFADFTTPQNCIVSNPTVFVESYALKEDHSTRAGPSSRFGMWPASQIAENNICIKKTINHHNIISQEIVNKWKSPRTPPPINTITPTPLNIMPESEHYKNNDNSGPNSCTNIRIKMQKRGGQTCFSAQPQNVCNPKCQAMGTIQKEVAFRCVNNDEARDFIQPVMRGKIPPKLSSYPANDKFVIDMPQSCKSSSHY